MLLLPQDDFHCTAGKDKKQNESRSKDSPSRKGPDKTPKMRGAPQSQTKRGSANPEASMTSAGFLEAESLEPLEAAFFLKWCRNGRAKRRYVEFDDSLRAIVWKDHAAAKPAGIFPLSNIQDICVGIVTPVARQAEAPPGVCCRPKSGPRLDPNLLISIIAEDRTLDLQASSLQVHQRWTDGLISRFRSHMEAEGLNAAASYRLYPPRFRSDRCELRLNCERLHSMTSFNTTLKVMQGASASPKVCHSCGLAMAQGGCSSCGAPPGEAGRY